MNVYNVRDGRQRSLRATIHSCVVIIVFFFYVIIRAAKRILHKRIHKLLYLYTQIRTNMCLDMTRSLPIPNTADLYTLKLIVLVVAPTVDIYTYSQRTHTIVYIF